MTGTYLSSYEALLRERDRIRMELYKEVYLSLVPEMERYDGNIAKSSADDAVKSFDEFFSGRN